MLCSVLPGLPDGTGDSGVVAVLGTGQAGTQV